MTCKKADNVKIINLRYEVNVWYAYCRPLQYEYHCSDRMFNKTFQHMCPLIPFIMLMITPLHCRNVWSAYMQKSCSIYYQIILTLTFTIIFFYSILCVCLKQAILNVLKCMRCNINMIFVFLSLPYLRIYFAMWCRW